MSSDAAGPPDGTGMPLGQGYFLHEALGHRATKRDTGEEVAAKVL